MSNLIDKYLGNQGHSRLVRILESCSLFVGASEVIDEITKSGLLIEFEEGDDIIRQGGEDNDIYFIVSGKVEVLINDRLIAERKAPNHIGEMSLVNPKELRSATIRSKKKSVLLKVQEESFIDCANKNPSIWRNIAIEVSDRLKQRERFFKEKNEVPKLFVGSSVENLDVARGVQFNLAHDNLETNIWTDSVFIASSNTIDDLLHEVNNSDFGLFILSDNDLLKTRKSEYFVPRDNVIFELGLFMGRLGKNRVMMIKPRGVDIKMPSDLLGVRMLDYNPDDSNLTSALGPACFELRAIINKLKSF